MIEAVLNVRIPELWVTPITEKYNASVTCKIGGHSTKSGWGIVTIKGEDSLLDKILEEIKQHKSVGGIEVKNRELGSVSFVVNIVQCKACEVLIRSKAFLVFPVAIQKGRMKWLLITDSNRTIGEVSDSLEKIGCDVKIDRVTALSEKGILTQRQEAVIRIAFSSGYFDYPRRISGLKLSSKLGISMSTLSEIMRTAQRRIFAEYIKT